MRKFLTLVVILLSLGLAGCEPEGVAKGRAAYDRGEFETALAWLRPVAESGNTDALKLLGFMHHDGDGVSRDYGSAVAFWQQAVGEHDPAAQSQMGEDIQIASFEKFFQGKGADQHGFKTALMWFRLSAAQGYAPAQAFLGDLYLNFEFAGIQPDLAEGGKWLRRAAEQGNLNGQVALGDMYNDGLGVPRSYGEAAKWYRLAADQGNPTAQTVLARMYRDGRGVPKDLVEAHIWFDIASVSGESSATRMRERAARSLSPDQVALAEKRARDWLVAHGPDG